MTAGVSLVVCLAELGSHGRFVERRALADSRPSACCLYRCFEPSISSRFPAARSSQPTPRDIRGYGFQFRFVVHNVGAVGFAVPACAERMTVDPSQTKSARKVGDEPAAWSNKVVTHSEIESKVMVLDSAKNRFRTGARSINCSWPPPSGATSRPCANCSRPGRTAFRPG